MIKPLHFSKESAFLIFTCLCFHNTFAQQATINVTGSTGSYVTGNVKNSSGTYTATDGNISIASMNNQHGWIVFDLAHAGVPSGAIIDAVTINFSITAITGSDASPQTIITAYLGDVSAETNAARWAHTAGDDTVNISNLGTTSGLVSRKFDYNSSSMIQNNLSSKLTVGFITTGNRVYNIAGYNSSLSPSMVINYTIVPLNINLNSFTATNIGMQNRIDWTTVNEFGMNKFIVQRSNDGRNFTDIESQAVHGSASDYTYWDGAPLEGTNYYRLKIADQLGALTYSKTANAIFKNSKLGIIQAFPNPVQNTLTVKINVTNGHASFVKLFDMNGKLISKSAISNYEALVDMHKLDSGIYFITYDDGVNFESLRVVK